MSKTGVLSALAMCFLLNTALSAQMLYKLSKSSVSFKSEAPMELIRAGSDQPVGLFDIGEKKFAFAVKMSSFTGFNSELQREHFNENYLETSKFPKASFAGIINDAPDLSKDGTFHLTAVGKLNVHGVEKVRTLPVKVEVKEGRMHLHSAFEVLLADHNIKIPSILSKKLSETIMVEVVGEMLPNQ